jgi:nickel-dependent lactate racemase
VIEHDSRDRENLIEVGELRPGLPLRLNRAAVEADLLMTLGCVRHHYFAGFGGGPKMVFPGVAGYEEIQANHALVLQSENGQWQREPRCEPGVLHQNPIAEEIVKAAEALEPDCAVCLVSGRNGGVAWAAAGTWKSSFDAAVERVRSWFEKTADPPFRLMVACGAGAPSDSTVIQGHKSLDAACRFLEPGGEILYVASLENGLGSPEMEPFVQDPAPERILSRLSRGWVQYGHTTLRLVEKTSRFRIRLLSNLDTETARRLGFDPVTDPEQILDRWRHESPGTTVGVMAESAVFPGS